MIAAIAIIAEQRIQEAMQRGEFDELPCKGRPLDLGDDANIPEDLRMAYRLLKNGGYLDEAAQGEDAPGVVNVQGMLASNPEEGHKLRQMVKLQAIEARIKERGRRRGLSLDEGGDYYEKVVGRISVRNGGEAP